MPYVLGIDIGGTTTAAAVCRRRGAAWSEAETVRLGVRSPAVASVLTLSPAGDFLAGDSADSRAPDGSLVARGFVRRVGDDVPLVVGGEPYPAQALTAALARWVVDRVEDQEDAAAEQVVLAHPASWGPYRQNLLYDALWQVGLGEATLVAAPVAAAETPASAGRLRASGVLAGYALGGSGFEASVVARTGWTAFDLLAYADRAVGGADLDDALVTRVRTEVGGDLGDPRSTDAAVRLAMSWLRRNCTTAREQLSVTDETAVRVPVPDSRGEVSVSVPRAAFADLIRPAVQTTVDCLVRTVRSCGLEPSELAGVLLVGGASQTPLVADLISAHLPCPILCSRDPSTVVARGAALAARPIPADSAGPPHFIRTGADAVLELPAEPPAPLPARELLPARDLAWHGAESVGQPPRPALELAVPEFADRGTPVLRRPGPRLAGHRLHRLRGRR